MAFSMSQVPKSPNQQQQGGQQYRMSPAGSRFGGGGGGIGPQGYTSQTNQYQQGMNRGGYGQMTPGAGGMSPYTRMMQQQRNAPQQMMQRRPMYGGGGGGGYRPPQPSFQQGYGQNQYRGPMQQGQMQGYGGGGGGMPPMAQLAPWSKAWDPNFKMRPEDMAQLHGGMGGNQLMPGGGMNIGPGGQAQYSGYGPPPGISLPQVQGPQGQSPNQMWNQMQQNPQFSGFMQQLMQMMGQPQGPMLQPQVEPYWNRGPEYQQPIAPTPEPQPEQQPVNAGGEMWRHMRPDMDWKMMGGEGMY